MTAPLLTSKTRLDAHISRVWMERGATDTINGHQVIKHKMGIKSERAKALEEMWNKLNTVYDTRKE